MPTSSLRVRHILVPTDFSDPADRAWRYARSLARLFKCRLHVLHVVAPPYLYDGWGTEGAALPMWKLMAEIEGDAKKRLEKLASRPVLTSAVTGSVVEEILKYVSKHRIDLVVMGTHGRGFVEHALLGSVAERVVQRSPVPVLTVRGKMHPTTPARRPRARKRDQWAEVPS
jgi:nucleotide-binding universal stress UspA family protein